jgi:hypothetical protein
VPCPRGSRRRLQIVMLLRKTMVLGQFCPGIGRRQQHPPARLNHVYGSNRSPDPPIWDSPDLHNTGGFSCCLWGCGAPQTIATTPTVILCKSVKPHIEGSGDRFELYRWFSRTAGHSCFRIRGTGSSTIARDSGAPRTQIAGAPATRAYPRRPQQQQQMDHEPLCAVL